MFLMQSASISGEPWWRLKPQGLMRDTAGDDSLVCQDPRGQGSHLDGQESKVGSGEESDQNCPQWFADQTGLRLIYGFYSKDLWGCGETSSAGWESVTTGVEMVELGKGCGGQVGRGVVWRKGPGLKPCSAVSGVSGEAPGAAVGLCAAGPCAWEAVKGTGARAGRLGAVGGAAGEDAEEGGVCVRSICAVGVALLGGVVRGWSSRVWLLRGAGSWASARREGAGSFFFSSSFFFLLSLLFLFSFFFLLFFFFFCTSSTFFFFPSSSLALFFCCYLSLRGDRMGGLSIALV